MNSRKKLTVILGVFLIVLAVPVYLVVSNEMHISNEKSIYKFALRPVDPVDFMRGRYIVLRFNTSTEAAGEGKFYPEGKCYVAVDRDKDGWAYFHSVSSEIPKERDYFETKVRWVNDKFVQFMVPFDKYYMNEDLAPLAESSYNEMTRDDNEFYATVNIHDGKAILMEVYYQDEPLKDYLRKRMK